MAKRKHSKRREINTIEDAIQEQGPLPSPATTAALDELDAGGGHKPLPLSLADIRTEALRAHSNTARTIADLEAWAAEIAATIAFLKARER